MASLNSVSIIGNVCGIPDVRTTPSGAKVANFTVATNEKYKAKDGKQVDTTEFHRVVFWRGLAEICESYVTKGKQIYLEGKLVTRKWEDKDGVIKYSTEIVGRELKLLGSKGDSSGSAPSQDGGGQESFIPPVNAEEDSLPF